jgi:hypothetical protein
MPVVKLRYEIDLANAIAAYAVGDADIRTRADLASHADPMLEAYRGRSITRTRPTRRPWRRSSPSWGPPLLEHPSPAEVAGATASAVLVTTNRDDPFIAPDQQSFSQSTG